jgi:hypothetical protein
MRLRFDQLGKQIGQQALGPSGPTAVQDEIAPYAQHADLRHEPDPARDDERARLGLLGRMASVLCLIELFSSAPDEDAVLGCVGKLIAFRQKRLRALRRKRALPTRGTASDGAFAKPFLWIVTAGRPTAVLAEFGARSVEGWPPAVYFSPGLFRVGLIVASELPRDRSTLLVRLMAAGPLLPHAIEDLSALPKGAPERAAAEQILLALGHTLGKKSKPTPEEEEFLVTMLTSWDDAREQGHAKGLAKGLAEGRAEGRAEARVEQTARAVLTVLRARGVDVPDGVRERILAERDPKRLDRWLEKAAVAASVDDVFGETG